jgi:hypothetical protein
MVMLLFSRGLFCWQIVPTECGQRLAAVIRGLMCLVMHLGARCFGFESEDPACGVHCANQVTRTGTGAAG